MRTNILAYRAQLQAKLDAVDAIISEMTGMTGTTTPKRGRPAKRPTNNGPTGRRKKRRMSAAGRAKIAKAARERWAKIKASGKNRL